MPNSFNDLNPPGDVAVAFARIEAKIDVALAQHGAKLEQHGSEIAGLREDHKAGLLRHDADVRELETRVSLIERTPTVSPRTLGAVVVGAAGVLGALFPFMEKLYN